MTEFGISPTAAAGAVAVVLLLVLLAEHEILRLVRSRQARGRRSALLVGIVPLVAVFVLIAVLRLSHIGFTHP